MTDSFGTLKEIVKTSLKIDMLILMIILYAAISIVAIPIVFVFLIGVILFAIFATSAPVMIIPLIIIGILFSFLFLAFLIGIGSIQNAMLVRAAKDSFENKKFKIMKIFNEVKLRWKSLLGMNLVLMTFYFFLLVLLFLPTIFLVINYIQNPPISAVEAFFLIPTATDGNLDQILGIFLQDFLTLLMLIGFTVVVFRLIILAISPFTILMIPLIVFEKIGVRNAIRKGIEIGKKNYFFNIKVLFLYFLIDLCAVLFFVLLLGFVENAAQVISTIYSIYFVALGAIAATKLYFINNQKNQKLPL